MPGERVEPSESAAPRTGGTAVAALREEAASEAEGRRRRLQLAALETSGERGFRRLTVQAILDRSGISRVRFYREFADKVDCYAEGYAAVIEALAADLLDGARSAPDWLIGFSSALEALDRFLADEPLLAEGALAEVHVAGGGAGVKRKEVFERLSRAIDLARRETSVSRHSPPPITAEFILSAIEAAVVRTFVFEDSEEFAAAIPDLIYIAASFYFGEDAAKSAYAKARRRRR